MTRDENVKKIQALLELKRRIVGVKLVKSEEEFAQYSGTVLKKPMAYCVAVKSAMNGHSIKLVKETSKCIGSTRVLGLVEADEAYLSGREAVEWLGLYENCEIASKIAQEAPICESNTYGVVVKPLEEFEKDPDVVLIIGDARTMMRILQGYSYKYGVCRNLSMCGNQAVCIEGTVIPYIEKHLNISVLCAGTRFQAQWREEELLAGIPFEQFEGTVEGLQRTVNPIEMDDKKRRIEKLFNEMQDTSLEIEYGKTYFWKAK